MTDKTVETVRTPRRLQQAARRRMKELDIKYTQALREVKEMDDNHGR